MLSLVIPLQITRTCSHSVNRLSLRHLMRKTLRTNFSEMQVIFDNGMHGAMTNAGLNTNLFLCDTSVFSDHTINPQNHIRLDGPVLGANRPAVMCVLREISSATRAHLSGTCRFRHSRRATMNLACSSYLSHQEKNHTSLLFLVCVHFQCWTNTLYTWLISRVIRKQLCGPVRFHYACLLPYRWQYRYVRTMLPAFARNVFYGGCSVFIRLPLIFDAEKFPPSIGIASHEEYKLTCKRQKK